MIAAPGEFRDRALGNSVIADSVRPAEVLQEPTLTSRRVGPPRFVPLCLWVPCEQTCTVHTSSQ